VGNNLADIDGRKMGCSGHEREKGGDFLFLFSFVLSPNNIKARRASSS
jgi:hypothetical protein